MRDFNTQQFTEQFESLFFGPARAYASLSVDYTEKLLRAQLDASQAYTETGIASCVPCSTSRMPTVCVPTWKASRRSPRS